MEKITQAVREAIAPTGHLRVAINYGNPVIAQQGEDGTPQGVSADLAYAFAKRLDLPIRFVPFNAAGKVVAALDEEAWDLAFLARDPLRAEKIKFSSPYVIIEGTYLVPNASVFTQVDELDRDGVRIAVGEGAAYDLFLTRSLTQAELVRAPTSSGAVDLFVERGLNAAAGVRQPLERYAESHLDYRVLPGHFTVIEQAMAMPRGRESVAAYMDDFIAEMKRSGFVAKALANSQQTDAKVAP